MRILILGAGALGGYFGARLLAAGRDVTFLVREGTAQTLDANGLRVQSAQYGDLALPTPPHQPQGEYDLVLLSAKAFDLDSAVDAIAPFAGPRTAVLPLLNGMAHMPVLDARFGPERVLGGTSFISATRAPDGTILHLGARALLYFGARAGGSVVHLEALREMLMVPGFELSLRTDIEQDQWEKWTFIAAVAGITCLFRASIGEIATAGATHYALDLYAECTAIAALHGHTVSDSFLAQHQGFLSAPDSNLTASALRDLEAGGEVETQQLVGDLYDRRGTVVAPLLALCLANLKAHEARRTQRG